VNAQNWPKPARFFKHVRSLVIWKLRTVAVPLHFVLKYTLGYEVAVFEGSHYFSEESVSSLGALAELLRK
jgi:hypothetical protein